MKMTLQMRKKTHSTLLLDLKDKPKFFWCDALDVKIVFVYKKTQSTFLDTF